MKVIGINGSPRKQHNTATMLNHALDGAKSQGAEIQRIDLYDLQFTGCKSCFACKQLDGSSHGRCAIKDELAPVLDKVLTADGLIVASPIYFGDVSGMTRCFLERLWCPSLLCRADGTVAYEKDKRVGLIYTMNVDDPIDGFHYDRFFRQNEEMMEQYIGQTKTIYVIDTYQYSDYTRYESGIFDPEWKKKTHDEQFPKDCLSAYELGCELTTL